MKKFLNGVPYIMVNFIDIRTSPLTPATETILMVASLRLQAVIQEIHKAAALNDTDALMKLCRNPVPPAILKSKDGNGVTALHKVFPSQV